MKKLRNLIIMILALFGVVGFNTLSVNAAPSTITLKSKSNLYYFTEDKGTDYLYGYNFYRKELTDGKAVYCVSNINTDVPAGKTLTLVGEITDKGLSYLLKNGYPFNSFTGDVKKDYYITQAAIWEYFDETRGSNNWGSHTFKASDTGMKKHVYNLVTQAKAENSKETTSASINIIVVNKGMTLDGSYYVSDPIRVNTDGTDGNYTVTLENAPSGTMVKGTDGSDRNTFSNGQEFRVYVPASTKTSGSLRVKATSNGTVTKAFEYTANQGKLQNIGYVVSEPVSVEAVVDLNFDVVTTKLKVSKQDITNGEELPGATLIITNSNGTEVAKWVSTTEPRYIEGLEPGTYTLTEKIAPKGYVLSEKSIEFTLERDGKVNTVVMTNEREQVTKLKVSKQDITNGEELPGATLVINDSQGTEVAKWVSTNEPHYIEGLKPGTYTLTETIAPKGYILSSSTIEFTLKADGKVETVVMYNSHEEITRVKISKQDITSKEELPGATLVIKDKDGNVVDTWVSTNTPHYIEGLKEGTYTLTETIAPDGYKLSEETIEFTLKADGKVETVVMYNAKYNVPITDLNVSTGVLIGAVVLMLLGSGIVFYEKHSH